MANVRGGGRSAVEVARSAHLDGGARARGGHADGGHGFGAASTSRRVRVRARMASLLRAPPDTRISPQHNPARRVVREEISAVAEGGDLRAATRGSTS